MKIGFDHMKATGLASISDGICGYVAGGVGNQLFMLAAAWEQSKRLDCPLYIDISHSSLSKGRKFELEQLISPAQVLTDNSPWTTIQLPNKRALPFPRSWNPFKQSIYIEKDVSIFSPNISKVKVGATLVGYFQSPQYFPTISGELTQSILSHPLQEIEKEILRDFRSDKRITLHLRRGDYMNTSNTDDLLASVDYAKRAISQLRSQGIKDGIRIFSDSPEIIIRELSSLNEDLQIADEQNSLSSIATLIAMSSGSAMIMSNSTFSWWGAWLMSDGGTNNKTIIAPRPWIGNGQSRADLLLKNWITLDARP